MFSVWRAGFLHPFSLKTIPSSAWKKFQMHFFFRGRRLFSFLIYCCTCTVTFPETDEIFLSLRFPVSLRQTGYK